MANLERSWNTFIRSMSQTKDAWERFRQLMEERPNLEHVEPQAQKYMCLPFNRATFFKAMPDFIRVFGNSRRDLKELLIQESLKTKTTTVEKEIPHGR